MWWILQIVGSVLVCIAQIANRYLGVCVQTYVIYGGIALFGTYFAFSKSYAIAPSFFSAWFVGQTAMNVFGFLAAFIIFRDSVTALQWIGCILSIAGGYLLIR